MMESMDFVLGVIAEFNKVNNGPPCKKTLQKLVYLIKEAGESVPFGYGIHFYGPYSSDLDYMVKYLHGHGHLRIDITPTNHNISVTESSTPPRELSAHASKVIDCFADLSPSELELLATTLYVQRSLKATDQQSIISGVTRIKKDKYSLPRIGQAIDRLRDAGYF